MVAYEIRFGTVPTPEVTKSDFIIGFNVVKYHLWNFFWHWISHASTIYFFCISSKIKFSKTLFCFKVNWKDELYFISVMRKTYLIKIASQRHTRGTFHLSAILYAAYNMQRNWIKNHCISPILWKSSFDYVLF